MKIIQTGLMCLAILGLRPTQSLINIKFFAAIFVYATNVVGNCMFLFHEASTFFEYANSIFLATTITMAATFLIIAGSVKTLMFSTIDSFTKLVEKSE